MNPISLFLDESFISKRINTRSGLEKIEANKCTKVDLISKVQFKNINLQFTEIGHILGKVVGKVLLNDKNVHCNITAE